MKIRIRIQIKIRMLPAGSALLAEKYGVDGEERIPVSGAAFTLYAAEDVRNIFGDLIYREGTEVETALSGADGWRAL